MENQVFDQLLGIFNSANYRFLSHVEITHLLKRKGLYQGIQVHKAEADVWEHLNRPTANYPFCWIERNDETFWGLERWLPPKKQRHAKGRKAIHGIVPLQLGREIQHTISVDEVEFVRGTFPLRGQLADMIIASLDEKQREDSVVELQCYGSEKIICATTQDERGNWTLEGMGLLQWYKENGLQSGDKIWLIVESVNPLTMRAYTEWDRDLDTYRRYKQRRGIERLPSTDLPIRDMIWLYFERSQKIAHRSEIIKALLVERPEISERSVDGCLGANSHLFVRVGERGYWGLKEWGIGQARSEFQPDRIKVGPSEILELPSDTNVPIDYILANIAAEDLVYRLLRNSKDSLNVVQITERIANYLGVDKNRLTQTTFFNSSDERFFRLEDGSFTLRETVREVVHTEEKPGEQLLVEVLSQGSQVLEDNRLELPGQSTRTRKTWPNRRMAVRCQGLFAILADHPKP